jgi:thioredoxin-like negative regulator of GroEL
MKTTCCYFLCALLLLPSLAPAEAETDWSTDYDKTLHGAAEIGHPLLLDFSATWCGPCQMMARTTLKDKSVTEKLASFLKVKVDIDANAKLAEQFGVHAVPTFVVLNSDGDEIVRTTGAADAATFGQWLNTALSTAAISAARQDLFKTEKASVVDGLMHGDPIAQSKALDMLLDYSFRKEKYFRDFAAENLKSAAKDHPAALLASLNNDKLAVRILAANLLRDQLGPDFVFDPWASAAVRTPIIDKWKTRLASSVKAP